MNLRLVIAGLICLALAVGHATIGFRAVIPNLTKDRFSNTSFGRPSLAVGMMRFTWHVVTLMLLDIAVLLTTLAVAEGLDPKTVVLRGIALLWLVATAIALWAARRRPRGLLRFPVALSFPVMSILCWTAS